MFPRKFTGPFELLFPLVPYSWGATLITFCSRVSPIYRHSRNTRIVTSIETKVSRVPDVLVNLIRRVPDKLVVGHVEVSRGPPLLSQCIETPNGF